MAAFGGVQLGQPNTFEPVDSVVQDLALQSRTPESYLNATAGQLQPRADPRTIITIVAIDERTIAELGAYGAGYPRAYQAQLVEQLLAGTPRVIAFDVGFFEPTSDDAALASAFAEAHATRPPTRIILSAVGEGPGGRPGPPGADGELRFDQSLEPLPALAAGSDIAMTNVLPDARGSIRSMPLVAWLGGVQRPSLGLAAAAAYLRRPSPLDGPPADGSVAIGGRQIPVDSAARVKINYFGPPSHPNTDSGTFRVVSFVDALHGRVDPAVWRGGLVFVGALDAAGLADDYWTPTSQRSGSKMAGVEIHANVAATIFSAQFVRDAPAGAVVGVIAGSAIALALLAAYLNVLGAVAVASAVLAGLVAASMWLVQAYGLLCPVTSPLLAGAFPFVGVLAFRVALEQRKSRALQLTLGSVIPPSVAREIARDPTRVTLGGERRTVTVLFADLKGFTSFSESVEPEIVSHVMTDFLGAMTEVIFRHGGTVDKFIGDAVMALWNAPLDDPEHARHACDAALDMHAALAELGAQWEKEGLPRQHMRIGINTGPASVGNMGTRQRFAYTALGDTINLGARLEPLNGHYGTSVCISRTTLDTSNAYDRYLVRFLDLVDVKGKKDPVPVYELIGHLADEQLSAFYLPVLAPYRQAVGLYQQGKFAAAAALFQVAMQANPERVDAPSRLYAERCAKELGACTAVGLAA
jgi:adenylate cyclase